MIPLRRLSIGILLSLLLGGCGYKGPVRPVEVTLPAAPQEVLINQQGHRFVVSWEAPGKNQDGSPIKDLDRYLLSKTIIPPGDTCTTCERDFLEIAQISPERLRQARRVGKRFYYWDPAIRPEYRYQYRIVAQTQAGKLGETATAQRLALLPPTPPTGLKASSFDQHVQLSWAPVEGASGYRLYRKSPDGIFDPWPLNTAALSQTSYTDFTVTNGTRYEYGLRAIWTLNGETVESELSDTVFALPGTGR